MGGLSKEKRDEQVYEGKDEKRNKRKACGSRRCRKHDHEKGGMIMIKRTKR
jgi:hypothetical protein